MRCMDLTHLISREMPVYPGTEPPRLQPANTYERDGFQETLLTMYSRPICLRDGPRWISFRWNSSSDGR